MPITRFPFKLSTVTSQEGLYKLGGLGSYMCQDKSIASLNSFDCLSRVFNSKGIFLMIHLKILFHNSTSLHIQHLSLILLWLERIKSNQNITKWINKNGLNIFWRYSGRIPPCPLDKRENLRGIFHPGSTSSKLLCCSYLTCDIRQYRAPLHASINSSSVTLRPFRNIRSMVLYLNKVFLFTGIMKEK